MALFRGGESPIVRYKKPMFFLGYLRKAKKEKGFVNFAPLYLGKGLSFRPVANNFAHKNSAVDIVKNLRANMEETRQVTAAYTYIANISSAASLKSAGRPTRPPLK